MKMRLAIAATPRSLPTKLQEGTGERMMTILQAFGLGILVAWLPSVVIVPLLAWHARCVRGAEVARERPSGRLLTLVRDGADARVT